MLSLSSTRNSLEGSRDGNEGARRVTSITLRNVSIFLSPWVMLPSKVKWNFDSYQTRVFGDLRDNIGSRLDLVFY